MSETADLVIHGGTLVTRDGAFRASLAIKDGASENAAVATSLLEYLVARGVDPARRYLFVIDGSKALRTAINKVFGNQHPVQRCRTSGA